MALNFQQAPQLQSIQYDIGYLREMKQTISDDISLYGDVISQISCLALKDALYRYLKLIREHPEATPEEHS